MFYTNCLKEHSSLTLTQIYSFQDGVVDVPKASDFNRLRIHVPLKRPTNIKQLCKLRFLENIIHVQAITSLASEAVTRVNRPSLL